LQGQNEYGFTKPYMYFFNRLNGDILWKKGIQFIAYFTCVKTLGNGSPRFNPFFIPKMIADIAPC